MKVLHVIPAVAARYGGPSHAVYQICAHLKNAGVVTEIATTNADGAAVLPELLGILNEYQGTPTIFFQRDFSEAFKYSSGLGSWLRTNVSKYDLVHIHAVFSHACLAAARACRRQHIPYLVRTIGNLDPWGLRQKRFRKQLVWHLGVKQMLRGAAAIHYTAGAEKELAETTLGLQHGVVIPLGVDEALLRPATNANPFLAQHPALSEGLYVLTLSRLHPKKNLETLIKVFLRLTDEVSLRRWKLVIAGEGAADYVEQLRCTVRLANGEARVVFAGWLQGEQKRGALRGAGLFALPSHQENFGLSLVEAMACEVPVLISERVNLADEVTAAGAGWVVALDERAIEAALHQALTSAAERLAHGQAARNLVLQRYRWSAVAEQLVSLYTDICGQG
ncbi:MAG: glycosyltransferase [Acidobacteria bacterium]|nr:glycosyltransferase [Acidobacteriota bacterium]MBI3425572.1 glycosyltransferase [Acidobacteriota bacterium]